MYVAQYVTHQVAQLVAQQQAQHVAQLVAQHVAQHATHQVAQLLFCRIQCTHFFLYKKAQTIGNVYIYLVFIQIVLSKLSTNWRKFAQSGHDA
jgi:hypothetical protein